MPIETWYEGPNRPEGHSRDEIVARLDAVNERLEGLEEVRSYVQRLNVNLLEVATILRWIFGACCAISVILFFIIYLLSTLAR
jgi:hypothetical protein